MEGLTWGVLIVVGIVYFLLQYQIRSLEKRCEEIAERCQLLREQLKSTKGVQSGLQDALMAAQAAIILGGYPRTASDQTRLEIDVKLASQAL